MAIIIEEDKKKSNIVAILGWLAVIGVLGAGVYYLFFAAPEFVVITPPTNLQYIAPISQVSLSPDDVLKSASFQLLKPPSFPLPTPQGPTAVGRTNPFIAP